MKRDPLESTARKGSVRSLLSSLYHVYVQSELSFIPQLICTLSCGNTSDHGVKCFKEGTGISEEGSIKTEVLLFTDDVKLFIKDR